MKTATDRSAAAKKAAVTKKRRAAANKAVATRKAKASAKKRSQGAVKAHATRDAKAVKKARSGVAKKAVQTRKRNAAAKPVDPESATNRTPPLKRVLFEVGQIVSVEYDNLNPEEYEEGTWIGEVVKRTENRIKVEFAYESGGSDIAWLAIEPPKGWIDKTWSCLVIIEEASPSQQDAFRRYVSR